MERKLAELNGKVRALEYAIKKSDEPTTNVEVLTRQINSIKNRIDSVNALKEEIEELKFTNSDSEENIQEWSKEFEAKITCADERVINLRKQLEKINETELTALEKSKREAADTERQKQLDFERRKYELQQAVNEDERRKELEHKSQLLQQQMTYQKSTENATKQQETSRSLKLPKLPVTRFDGNFANWLPFWNMFEAEIDKGNLPVVTKFAYLKEWLESKVRTEIDGLPFTTEGYQRAKNILQSEYGKTSEIVNTHVQNIIGLPVIDDSDPSKVNEFYKSLHYNTQALETMGKLEKVSGITRTVLEKLKGIKADLVRGNSDWQEWDLGRLISEIKKWRDINPVEEGKVKR